jgi:hypothetical protein
MKVKKAKQPVKQVEEVSNTEAVEVIEVIEPPKPRQFEARPCSSCCEVRPYGKNYSRVYCTRGSIRYCRCDYCGHTWSQEGK